MTRMSAREALTQVIRSRTHSIIDGRSNVSRTTADHPLKVVPRVREFPDHGLDCLFVPVVISSLSSGVDAVCSTERRVCCCK